MHLHAFDEVYSELLGIYMTFNTVSNLARSYAVSISVVWDQILQNCGLQDSALNIFEMRDIKFKYFTFLIFM